MAKNSHDDVRALLTDPTYVQVTHALAAAMRSRCDMSDLRLSMVLSSLEAADVHHHELLALLHRDRELVTDWVIRKARFLAGEPEAQEYPDGEEPDPEDADDVLDSFYGAPSLALMLCELYLITARPRGVLEAWLKRERVPGPVRYARDLRRLVAASRDAVGPRSEE